jgi:hypothetical protein
MPPVAMSCDRSILVITFCSPVSTKVDLKKAMYGTILYQNNSGEKEEKAEKPLTMLKTSDFIGSYSFALSDFEVDLKQASK